MAERGEFGPPGGLSSPGGGGDRVSFYMDDINVTINPDPNKPFPNINEEPSVSLNYRGRLGYGKGTLTEKGFNYNFNPALNPNFSIYGQNFETPSFSYNVPTMDPRIGASLNLQGNQGQFNPSISANYSTFGNTISGSVSPTGYGVRGRSNNLFGIPGLNFEGRYGDSGYRGMISYGSDR